MSKLRLTRHATARIQQRGMKLSDADIIREYGVVIDDGILMTTSAIADASAHLRKTLARLEKLSGRLLITDGEWVITGFKATPRQIRRKMG
jgi:hypothetical protein